MLMLTIVAQVDGTVDLTDDRENALQYAAIKGEVLPYCEVLMLTGLSVRNATARRAPLGTVRSAADAQTLMLALKREFPSLKLAALVRAFSDADDVVYLSTKSRLEDQPCRPLPKSHYDAGYQSCAS